MIELLKFENKRKVYTLGFKIHSTPGANFQHDPLRSKITLANHKKNSCTQVSYWSMIDRGVVACGTTHRHGQTFSDHLHLSDLRILQFARPGVAYHPPCPRSQYRASCSRASLSSAHRASLHTCSPRPRCAMYPLRANSAPNSSGGGPQPHRRSKKLCRSRTRTGRRRTARRFEGRTARWARCMGRSSRRRIASAWRRRSIRI